MRFFTLKTALAATLAVLSLTAPVKADTLEWTVRSDYPHVVSLEFYSQTYNRAWPGDGRVHVIDDYNVHSYVLACETGEKICYGAWVRGIPDKYWGVGYNDTQGCADCCYSCGYGSIPLRILNQ